MFTMYSVTSRPADIAHGVIIMERPTGGGGNMIYPGGGDPLCTLHRKEELYTARFATGGA